MIFIMFFVGTLSLILGSSLSFLFKKTASNFIMSLGFSAGIMLFMSLSGGLEMSGSMLNNLYSPRIANLYNTILFCISVFFTFILDRVLNKINLNEDNKINKKLTLLNIDKINFIRMFLFILIAITIHNISEGLYTIYRIKENLDDLYFYMAISILHNVIEGVAIGLPIYALVLSFVFSVFSMLSMSVIYLIINGNIDFRLLSFLMTLSSALMLYLVFMNILPFSQKYSISYNTTFLGIVLGILSMMTIVNVSPYLIKLFNFIY